MLKNIKESGIKYLAITNHDSELFDIKQNINIKQFGDTYQNNIYLEPFNFTNPIDDISYLINNKEMEKGYGNLIIFNIQEQIL